VVVSIVAVIGRLRADLRRDAPDIRPTAVQKLWPRADVVPDVVMRTTASDQGGSMRTWRMRALLAVVGALFVLPTATAQAALVEVEACDDATLTKPFQRWADVANYKPAPGGDFEGDLAAWTLSGGAKTVAGSEPWGVTGAVGSRALALPAGASAVAPATCVTAGAPTFRFFARSTGGLLPLLRADLLYRDGALRIVPVPVGIVPAGGGWQPTLPMLTASAVGAALAGGEAPLAIRFTAVSGSWQIDDVFVDPYSRG
jgi:hypothetical protein